MAANPLVLLLPTTTSPALSVSWLVRLRLASVLGLLPLIYGHGLARLSDRRRRRLSRQSFWAWLGSACHIRCLFEGVMHLLVSCSPLIIGTM